MIMRWSFLPAVALVCVGVFASEIVTKSSAPFYFPSQVSAVRWNPASAKGGAFTSRSFGPGNKGIELSWTLPAGVRSGSIALFNVAGVCMKTFPVTTPSGNVVWNSTNSGRVARGIYFANFSCAGFKKNLKLLIF
jgi:hypothetical protein